MLVLALDASSPVGSIALHDESGSVGVFTVSVDLTHSEGLMPAVADLLRRAGKSVDDLTALACITGPGSYTGLRVGIASAQGLALAKNLPCVGLSSLDVLSWALPMARFQLCPLLPARKGWLYARLYRWGNSSPQAATEELYVQPDELASYIDEPTVFYGPGLAPYRRDLQEMLEEQFIAVPDVFHLPRADILAELAVRELKKGGGVSLERLLPHYLGPSQAEINWKRRQASGARPS
ncbi:MAG: tRNA (adenosine(37)-N6)-threonylcarbamoyltransferase complex dimerization subunit type 1 TsaB [Candidatus Omnitrophica bacterium]|nr:tRNA (adenosine(37)-N6)-threonylcarbamoyltransferase complex dimerization subunit type 1 TsaB [Candidatus Omnitrophota bacterium]